MLLLFIYIILSDVYVDQVILGPNCMQAIKPDIINKTFFASSIRLVLFFIFAGFTVKFISFMLYAVHTTCTVHRTVIIYHFTFGYS